MHMKYGQPLCREGRSAKRFAESLDGGALCKDITPSVQVTAAALCREHRLPRAQLTTKVQFAVHLSLPRGPLGKMGRFTERFCLPRFWPTVSRSFADSPSLPSGVLGKCLVCREPMFLLSANTAALGKGWFSSSEVYVYIYMLTSYILDILDQLNHMSQIINTQTYS